MTPNPLTIETELLESGYKDLGWMNAWSIYPDEYQECCKAEHKKQSISLNRFSTLNIYKCEHCKTFFKVDTSD